MLSVTSISKKWLFFIFGFLAVISIFIFMLAGIRKAAIPVSYLPKNIPSSIGSLPSGERAIQIGNSWYNITVDNKGKVDISGHDGKIIVSSLTYYGELKNGNNQWGLQNVVVNRLNDTTAEIKGNGINNDEFDLLMISNSRLPKIEFRIQTKYNKTTIVNREALVASFNLPVSQVYCKNREVASKELDPEYWLLKQGVLFSDQKNSALIYHTPGISSLQLETNKKLLFINLDYDLDHPFVNLPYQADAGRRWVNLSQSDYKNNSLRENSFSIYINPVQKVIPRLMLVPSGYKAGYVFTEHADGGNIRTQRAAYFGSESITNAKDAIGGFVKYKIPVTKSIFYTGPPSQPGASIYEGGKVSPLLGFLDQLNATGIYDLCMHTPDDSTSNSQTLEESIKFMKERYNTISWIDHGFYGGKINRESMACDGLDSLSPLYGTKLWKKYDTKYFWSPSVEMIRNSNWVSVTENVKKLRFFRAYVAFLQRYVSPDDLKQLNFIQIFKKAATNHSYRFEMNTLQYNSGSSFPTPLYWQDPTRTQNFYSWATDQEKAYGDLSEKEIENEKEQLSNLIDHQGIFIDHGYFVRNRSDDRNLKTINGKLVVNANFDKILSLISDSRAKGDLFVTTIRDLLNYWILLEKVEFEYLPDGSINVINNNDQPIKGLSMTIKATNILVDGKAPATKQSGDDTIFWFDVAPHQQVSITMK